MPRHAVLASAVCYGIAKCLNEKLLQKLGPDGLIYMAAHYSLLADERIPVGARKSTEIVIRHVLVDRSESKMSALRIYQTPYAGLAGGRNA